MVLSVVAMGMAFTGSAAAEEVTVGNSAALSDAINNAGDGDTIIVEDGTYEYTGDELSIDTANVTLAAESSATPTIRLDQSETTSDGSPTISVEAEGVSVDGLRIERNASGSGIAQGVRVSASDTRLSDLDIVKGGGGNNDQGVTVLDAYAGESSPSDTSNVTLENVDASGFHTGIGVSTQTDEATLEDVTISGGTVSDNEFGIGFAVVGSVSDSPKAVSVDNVQIENNTVGVRVFGDGEKQGFIGTIDASGITLEGNHFTGNTDVHVFDNSTSSNLNIQSTFENNDNTFNRSVVRVTDGEYAPRIWTSPSAAISSASKNATVKVGSGSYKESVTIGVEGLTLESTAGADSTTISADATEGVMITESNVTVRGFTVTTNLDDTDTHGQYGIRLEPNGGVEDILIEDNVVQDISDTYRPAGISLDLKNTEDKTAKNVTVRDNIVRNITSVESESDESVAKGINPNERFQNLTVENNTIRNIGGENSAGALGIDFSSDTGANPNAGPKNFTIKHNDIDGIAVGDGSPEATYKDALGLYLHEYGDLGEEHTVTQNNFTNVSIRYNTNNVDDPDTLNATHNWWGAQYPDFDTVVDNLDTVNVTPWYTDAERTQQADGIKNVDQGTEHPTINHAIASANEGQTIVVPGRTYNESVAIDTAGITLKAEDPNNQPTIRYADSSNDDGTAALYINKNDVSVENITVHRIAAEDRKQDADHAQGIRIQGSNVDVENPTVIGSDLNHADRDYHRFDGILVYDGGTETKNVDIGGAHVEGFHAGVVTTVWGDGDGGFDSVSNITVHNSEISNNTDGVVVKTHSDTVVPENVQILESSIHNNSEFGVYVVGQENIIKENYQGYNITNANASEVDVTYNNIKDNGIEAASATDTSLDAWLNWWGSADGPQSSGQFDEAVNDTYYDPFLTAPHEQVNKTDSDDNIATRQFASDLTLESGVSTIAFPAPSERTLAETVNLSNVETIYAYDNSQHTWLSTADGTLDAESTTPNALSAYILVVKDGKTASAVMEFDNDFDGTTKPDPTEVTTGWNLVSPTRAGDTTDAAFDTTDATVENSLDYQFADQTRSQPFGASERYDYSPYRGYWTLIDEEGEDSDVHPATYDGLTLDEYLKAVNLDED
ncbi:surface glycoprotein [Halopenitus persicus]|uniref:Surface glycoprotein n=2 Tax=Halopenitus persicus TaxID=1048396 RepID=A0A1H3HF33_9EURY|nr:surface glycoprotein [Halopenitus persicus]